MLTRKPKRFSILMLITGCLVLLINGMCYYAFSCQPRQFYVTSEWNLLFTVCGFVQGGGLIALSFLSQGRWRGLCDPLSSLLAVLWGSVAGGFVACALIVHGIGVIGASGAFPFDYAAGSLGVGIGGVALIVIGIGYVVMRLRRFSLSGALLDMLLIALSAPPAYRLVGYIETVLDHYVFV